MKFLIIGALLVLFGSVGVVVFHEMGKDRHGGGASATGAKIETISHGEEVALESHLGGHTVVYFAADW